MKVVILAGGRGTRLQEETVLRPKPMVEIGGKPILWHIMKMYAAHGFTDFLIACGYKGEMIKEYFGNFFLHESDYVIDLRDGSLEVVNSGKLEWKVGVVDTGQETMTGGRILRLREWIGDDTFMATYGDGVGSIDIGALLRFHGEHGRLATVTAVRPPARFGELVIEETRVTRFAEKLQAQQGWINGGFFVFEPGVFDYLEGDHSILERAPLQRLALDGQLMAFLHDGFWQPMDTLREREQLEQMWAEDRAPWKCW
jgi:glucose-1-phosphate cytidylyltransferase